VITSFKDLDAQSFSSGDYVLTKSDCNGTEGALESNINLVQLIGADQMLITDE